MKPAHFAIMLLLVPGLEGSVARATAETCTLTVHITGLRNHKGYAAAVIFASPKGWPEREDEAYAKDGVSITSSQASLSFHLPPGKYGVAVLHDENQNHKLDRNFLGIPSEGFGFANNPRVLLTAPPFRDAVVNVGCPVTSTDVKMIYK